MPSEFDRFADDYADLLRDPIRDRFATGSRFFQERKWILIQDFFHTTGRATHGAHWLDIGCGQGQLLRLGRPAFARVAGCDLSAGMLKASQGIEVRLQTHAAVLPFADKSFDFVTAVCVYHHVALADRARLTREARRILRPGGIFCLMEHNPLNPVTRRIVRRAPVDVNAVLLAASEARNWIAEAGLRCLVTWFFLYLPERLYRSLAPLEGLMKTLPLGGQYAVFAQKN